jgi:siroheme synthase
VSSTIAILMGVAHRREIAAELQAGGLAPATPVAVIESATTGREVVSRCTLDADAGWPARGDRRRRGSCL